MTKVGIAIINWNRKKDTLELLESLKKLDTHSASSGQASTVETKTFVVSNQKIKGDFELIFKKENRGSAGGYNDGAKRALAWGADYILLLNNDTLLKSPKLLKSLIETAKLKPEIGIVSPKMYFAPGFEFYRERYSTRDTGNVLWYAGGDFDWNNINSSHHGIDEVDTGKYDKVEETNFANGTCMLVKKAVYQKNLFWDEGLFAYLDDNDFQERLTRAGFKKYYDGHVSIYHKVSRTSGIGSPISDYYLTRNRLIFGMRYAPFRTKFALLREAIRILISGRPMQKQGVKDFLMGKRGALVN